jgi:small GTP-binding protein
MSSLNESPCKILLLGDSGVGKTAIIHRLTKHEFRGNFRATIGFQFNSLPIETEYGAINFHLWDTAGDVHSTLLTPLMKTKVHFCVIIFDVTDRQSFEHVRNWREDFLREMKIPGKVEFVVLANKCDTEKSEWKVSISEAKERFKDMKVFKVSAKTGKISRKVSILLKRMRKWVWRQI